VALHHYPAGRSAPTLILAHGAGAGQDHPWMRRVATGLTNRGVSVVTFDFPYVTAGRKMPDRGAALEEFLSSLWRDIVGKSRRRFFAGGKSMGGRIASQVAAASLFSPAPAGLAFFGYPLHPPGQPEKRRDGHLPDVDCPMLFLHGTRDPFGSPEEMQSLTKDLRHATLHVVEGGDHSLVARKRDDPEGRALERALDVAAGWIMKT
jgi:predicted alpha/beta-hydrolase family hydrolase